MASKEYPAGTQALITGWGKTGAISSIPRDLQMAYTVLDSAETCQAAWDGVIVITDRMQCAGASTSNSGCNVRYAY